MNLLLTRLDPGNFALTLAATSAVLIALAALGAEALAWSCRKLGAAARHDLLLGGLVVIALSPAIVVGVARSGLVLRAWPTWTETPAPIQPTLPPIPTSRPHRGSSPDRSRRRTRARPR